MGTRRWLAPRLLTALALLSTGALLLAAVGSYYGYRAYSHSQLDRLIASSDAPVALSEEAAQQGFTPADDYQPSSAATAAIREADSLLARYSSAYPGDQMHPMYWGDPLWAGGTEFHFQRPAFPDGFRRITSPNTGMFSGGSSAQRIVIPDIGVDSTVSELAIVDLGSSRAYDTPKNVVGHIPETSNPGEVGNGWYFGHLESPIKGEGNVFQRLPKLPGLLRNGDPVYIVVESAAGQHLYQVTQTTQVHQDDLELTDSDSATITLVTCVPRLVYDHRLVVTAELVGVKN